MNPKRKTLLTMAVGGSSTALGTAGGWRSPVVQSVVLPAHALTSVGCMSSEICDFRPETPGGQNEEDAVFLLSDGLTCRFVPFDCCQFLPETMGNRILMVDADACSGDPALLLRDWDGEDGEDEEYVGDDNWNLSPSPGDDNDEGTFQFIATRTGGGNEGIYDLTLVVDESRFDRDGLSEGDECPDDSDVVLCYRVSASISPRSEN